MAPLFHLLSFCALATDAEASEKPTPAPGESRPGAADPRPHGLSAGHDHETHGHGDDPSGARVRRVEVEVDSEGPPRVRKAASELVVPLSEVSRVPRSTPENLLEFSPGVVIGNFAEAAHPGTIFLRGFASDDGKDLETTVEGVPINEVANTDAHGFSDIRFLIPDLVTHVRLSQGSFDPVQGDFAVAGSAAYGVGLATRGLVHRVSYDNWGRGRTAVLFGPPGTSAGTFVAAEIEGGPGYGEQRQTAAGRAMAGYEHDFGGHTHLRLLGAYYRTRFAHPGVVRLDDARAGRVPCERGDDPFLCAYDPRLGGAFDRVMASARYFRHTGTVPFSVGAYAVGRSLRLRENFTGFTTDLDHPGGPRGDGLRQQYDVAQLGVRASVGLRGDLGGRPHGLDVGFDLRTDDGRAGLDRVRFDDASPYATLFDNRFSVRHLATFASAHLEPAPGLALDGGGRMASFWVRVTDRVAGRTTTPAPAVAVLPRVSSTWSPVSFLSVQAAYGQGLRSADPNGLRDAAAVVPTRTHAAETGLRLWATGIADVLNLDGRLFGFYTYVARDLVFDEEDGRNRDIGATHRYGVGAALSLDLVDLLVLRASGARASAHSVDPTARWRLGRGPEVPYIPRWSGRLDAVFGHDFDVAGEPFVWHLALGATFVGKRPLPSGRDGPGYVVADAAADLRWRWVEVGLSVRNLANSRYFPLQLEYASNFDPRGAVAPARPALHVAPGAPLTVMGTLRLHYGPGKGRHFARDRRSRKGRHGPPGRKERAS